MVIWVMYNWYTHNVLREGAKQMRQYELCIYILIIHGRQITKLSIKTLKYEYRFWLAWGLCSLGNIDNTLVYPTNSIWT